MDLAGAIVAGSGAAHVPIPAITSLPAAVSGGDGLD
jgi:hypothetical protein